MKTKFLIALAVGVTLLFAALSSCAGPLGRGGYESAPYTTVKTDGAFEIRDYPEIVVATATMKDGNNNQNSGFMSLFRYISGKNEAEQKIAMTTPVFSKTGGSLQEMSFVLPEEVAKEGAPKANNNNITVTKRQAGRFVVYRYSGRWTEARDKKARETLAKWAKEQDFTLRSVMEKASYDPPFTPPFMRRNEVLARIE
ncbi:MAG: heme-binding protein [Akkermansiaceae bacterium]|nr:heme-binding protein [Akkermansiaceae bacterium]